MGVHGLLTPATSVAGVRDLGRSGDGLPTRRMRRARLAIAVFVLDVVALIVSYGVGGGFTGLGTAGGVFTTAGRLSALVATNLLIVQLLLIGRNVWLERTFGFDRLARWHRMLGHVAFDLIVLHVVLTTVGLAQLSDVAVVHEFVELVLRGRDVLMATVALALLVLVVATSVRAARRRLRHETWHTVHIYAYLAVGLAVPHQIFLGSDFARTLPEKAYWALLYTATVGSVLVFRVSLPLWKSSRHRLRVADVVPESRDVVSIYLEGHRLEEIGAVAGQFFIWRFLCRGQWWQAHPYSLSAAPNAHWLRISVKDLGRGSGELAYLVPGTRVMFEGPFGTFTADRRTRRRVLLIAGGVGVTPVRALFESLPARRGDITFVYRVRERADLVFLDEIRELAGRRNARVHVIIGRRTDFPRKRKPLGPGHLRRLVPNIVDHDVYVCGPEPLTQQVERSLRRLGVAPSNIHFESFAF